MMKKELTNLFISALLVSLVGGLVAMILNMFFGGLILSSAFASLTASVIVLILLTILAKSANIDNLSAFNMIIYLFAISIVGSIIAMFIPSVASVILVVDSLTLSGIAFTILYIMIAEIGLSKIKAI